MRWKSIIVWIITLFGVSGIISADTGASLDGAQAENTRTRRLAIGMNLSNVSDWNQEWVFVDVFKHSRPWIPQKAGDSTPWDTGEEIDVTPGGWPILRPGQAAATIMCRGLDGHYPGGSYTLAYEGTGKVTVGFDAKNMVKRGPNRYAVQVVPSNGGIYLRIDGSDPKDPIRNIHFWMPGFEDQNVPFHPLFLRRLGGFKVIRFMDWQQTNHSKRHRWTDRTTLHSVRQSSDEGVAIEYTVNLCNTLDADPWFCMPHWADDDFVARFAQLVRDGLSPKLKVYVEWSNEVWNMGFEQGKWIAAEAQRQGNPRGHIVAQQARRDWTIWREVFGDEKDRIIRVVAGHHHGPRYLPTVLDRLNGEFDAVSCSAYFHVPPKVWATLDEHTTVDDVICGFEAGVREYDPPGIVKHHDLARQWSKKLGRHIPFIAYEGGPSYRLRGPEKRFQKAMEAAQTDPRMYGLYTDWLGRIRDIGVELFVAFNYVGPQSRYGSWGHLTYQNEPLEDAPKFRVVWDAARGYLPTVPGTGQWVDVKAGNN